MLTQNWKRRFWLKPPWRGAGLLSWIWTPLLLCPTRLAIACKLLGVIHARASTAWAAASWTPSARRNLTQSLQVLAVCPWAPTRCYKLRNLKCWVCMISEASTATIPEAMNDWSPWKCPFWGAKGLVSVAISSLKLTVRWHLTIDGTGRRLAFLLGPTIWRFPKLGVPPISTPKMIIFSRNTHGFVGETHHFRKPPSFQLCLLLVSESF